MKKHSQKGNRSISKFLTKFLTREQWRRLDRCSIGAINGGNRFVSDEITLKVTEGH